MSGRRSLREELPGTSVMQPVGTPLPAQGRTYAYDPIGNRTYTRNFLDPSKSDLYSYDARNRLRAFGRGVLNAQGTAITTPLMDTREPSSQLWNVNGGMDTRGNWLGFQETLNSVTTDQTRVPDGVNQYLTVDPDGSGQLTPVSLGYDPKGNLTADPLAGPDGQYYEYDHENRLTAVRKLNNGNLLLEIRYDALGRRVESLEYAGSGGTPTRVTRHVYDGNEVVAEYEVSGGQATLAREFAWGDAFPDPVAMVLPNGTSTEVYYHVKDSLGSVVALVDYYGDAVETYRYDPYGRVFASDAAGNPLAASAVGNPFTYTGQRYDWAVGLHHFKYRSYSPRLGRWMQRDPAGYVDGVNLYQYVGSAPVNGVDPLGLLWGEHNSLFDWPGKLIQKLVDGSLGEGAMGTMSDETIIKVSVAGGLIGGAAVVAGAPAIVGGGTAAAGGAAAAEAAEAAAAAEQAALEEAFKDGTIIDIPNRDYVPEGWEPGPFGPPICPN